MSGVMKTVKLSVPVVVTIIYVPLMLFGLLGNILTILVVWLRPHMRSSTYLYLSSMAISDLLILLLLPLDLYKVGMDVCLCWCGCSSRKWAVRRREMFVSCLLFGATGEASIAGLNKLSPPSPQGGSLLSNHVLLH